MAKTRDRRKAKPQPKTKIDIEAPIRLEGKIAVALAFEGLGGVDALVTWAKTNEKTRTAFYSLFAKLIPMTVAAQVNVKNDGEAARRKLQSALLALIDAERSERIQEVSKPLVVIDAERAGAAVLINSGPRVVETPPAPSPDDTKPANIVPLRDVARSTRPSIPGLAAGAAPEGADNRSSTEKFYSWNGHGRPP